jgi:hypothetical protein
LFVGKSNRSASYLFHGINYEKFTLLFVTGNFCEPHPVTCENHVMAAPEIQRVWKLVFPQLFMITVKSVTVFWGVTV